MELTKRYDLAIICTGEYKVVPCNGYADACQKAVKLFDDEKVLEVQVCITYARD